ncbi:CBS domain-containing protein [Virgibacillus halodenitrificans]|uniref:CBS domain-containing protein n=1 Tax=Virgibacillus halodenitrificans TaxID=1482 RepID=UPI000761A845|nr:CBS domain-containing protein [Virgibacillus halodenitrificans]WHX24836.1 CBS domain-containing protein [Virgibacillus halodenitrificans]
MFKNSEKFLTAFNRIEKELRSMMINKKDLGFSKMVKILRNSNSLVKRYSEDLLEFAELRNAIVHNKVELTHAIAEPHDSIVDKIETIQEELAHPKKVIPLFNKKVHYFDEQDSLADMLHIIHEKGHTKFPVYANQTFMGLLTQKGITNWLAENNGEGSFSFNDILLKDVLPFEEKDNVLFISASTSIYAAVELYKEYASKGKRLEALLITRNGSQEEKLAGIITTSDILEIP